MGVMSCHRPDCENIMCDVYVDGIGYVCWECEKEFKEYLEDEGLTIETEGEIQRHLKMFMSTEKDSFDVGDAMDVEDFFNQHRK